MIENCKGKSNGLGLENQGKEHTIEELGEYDETLVKKVGFTSLHRAAAKAPKTFADLRRTVQYPLVWVNPVTGEKAFQVHTICVRKLFLRSSPTEEPKVIEDLVEIRNFLADIQHRILKPQFILMAPVDEGDVAIWDNFGVFHSAVDYPVNKYGPRSMHQANIGASSRPVGPVPVPV